MRNEEIENRWIWKDQYFANKRTMIDYWYTAFLCQYLERATEKKLSESEERERERSFHTFPIIIFSLYHCRGKWFEEKSRFFTVNLMEALHHPNIQYLFLCSAVGLTWTKNKKAKSTREQTPSSKMVGN